MDSLRADVDRLRERAKAVANLLATASGALIAGLFFSSQGESLATSTKLIGCIGVGVLILSVCFFLSASIYQSKIPDVPGIVPDTRSIEQLIKDVDAAARKTARSIWRRTRAGKIVGLVALALLCLMWPAPLVLPDERIPVSVQLLSPVTDGVRACPLLKAELEGEMKRKDIDGNSAVVAITVSREQCGGAHDSTQLYLERSKLLVSSDAR